MNNEQTMKQDVTEQISAELIENFPGDPYREAAAVYVDTVAAAAPYLAQVFSMLDYKDVADAKFQEARTAALESIKNLRVHARRLCLI